MKRESILWYEQPAGKWTEALPIGNGRMGAMVFGGIKSERVQLNEDSVWSGGYRDRNNPDAKKSLTEIRSLLRIGKVQEAENLSRYTLTGTPEYQRTYQTLGDLFLTFQNIPETSEYKRCLSLEEAITFTEFTADGFKYKREVLASAPADVITIKLTTENPDGLSFDARIVRNRFCENTGSLNADTVFFNGTNGGANGISFHCMMTGEADGGQMLTMGEYIVFKKVKKAILYITAATSFRYEDTLNACKTVLQKAKEKGYERIRAEHIHDYQTLENRVTFCLGESESLLPTDKRLTLIQQGQTDQNLIALYFRYNRYLLISCSRPGSLPANLQGVWCNDFLSPWDSKYTININTQMNYWPAETCNLSECHLPLFEHLHRMFPKGKETAQKMYGARGFVAHHNTDIWGDTAPQDTWIPATYWVMGAAWLCLHIWEHYEFTHDEIFLCEHFDLLKNACLFFLDFLIENESGELVISPTASPENAFLLPDGKTGTLCEGCAMDTQIITELFLACEQICHILKKDIDFALLLKNYRGKLPPIRIGRNGSIMEWVSEREEAEPGHRHMSHLFALFPGNTISIENTPELAQAARKTLELRLANGGGHTGWSRAWIINFWAKLGDSKEAYNNLYELLRHSTLPNLFDDHPPFQIDGNFGAAAAIAQMFVQSSGNTVYLLKALPEEWQNGSFTGLCAKGGLVIDLFWTCGKLSKACFYAKHDYNGIAIYGNEKKSLCLTKNEKTTWQF